MRTALPPVLPSATTATRSTTPATGERRPAPDDRALRVHSAASPQTASQQLLHYTIEALLHLRGSAKLGLRCTVTLDPVRGAHRSIPPGLVEPGERVVALATLHGLQRAFRSFLRRRDERSRLQDVLLRRPGQTAAAASPPTSPPRRPGRTARARAPPSCGPPPRRPGAPPRGRGGSAGNPPPSSPPFFAASR